MVRGVLYSHALLGGFAIGARVSLYDNIARMGNISGWLYSLYAWLCQRAMHLTALSRIQAISHRPIRGTAGLLPQT